MPTMDRSSRPLDSPCPQCGGVQEFVERTVPHPDLATYCCDECNRFASYPVQRDE